MKRKVTEGYYQSLSAVSIYLTLKCISRSHLCHSHQLTGSVNINLLFISYLIAEEAKHTTILGKLCTELDLRTDFMGVHRVNE